MIPLSDEVKRWALAHGEMERLTKQHEIELGMIGRFLEKLFGSSWYSETWEQVKKKYNIEK